jgi:hypothetical protein
MKVSYHCAWLLEQLSKCESLFNIIVAHMKALHDSVTRPEDEPRREVDMHKNRAISLLRERMLQPHAAEDDGVVLTIIYLSHHEAAMGDLAASAVHRQRLLQLLDQRGGMKSWKSDSGTRAVVGMYAGRRRFPLYSNLLFAVSEICQQRSSRVLMRPRAITRNCRCRSISCLRSIDCPVDSRSLHC